MTRKVCGLIDCDVHLPPERLWGQSGRVDQVREAGYSRLGRVVAGVGCAALLASASMGNAQGFDLHAFWDSRCQDCHGHAGAFARQTLTVVDGRLQGRHHRENLKQFLAQHEMGPEHVEGIYAMLLAQVVNQPIYQQKCAGCHKSAAEFARASLVMKDGVAVGKSNGQPIAQFLQRHGRLTAQEQPVVIDALTRVLGEVGGAVKR